MFKLAITTGKFSREQISSATRDNRDLNKGGERVAIWDMHLDVFGYVEGDGISRGTRRKETRRSMIWH